MKKEAFIYFLFTCLLLCFSSAVFAQVEIPEALANFYSSEISSLTLSNTSLLLYSDFDRDIIYYLYYNSKNTTLNLTINIDCTSENCPPSSELLLDYMKNDETLPYVKKAAGIFVLTNNTPLGVYDYKLTVSDSNANYTDGGSFTITVISSNFWKQFWHNVVGLFTF